MGICVALALAAAADRERLDAQVSTFDLSGTVKDDQGGVLPGVTVTVRNEETGLTRTVVTDAGRPLLLCRAAAAGHVARCRLSSPASRPHRRQGLRFAANTKPIINVTLTVGTVAETVTVVGETALLDTGQAMKAMSITQEQIRNCHWSAATFSTSR